MGGEVTQKVLSAPASRSTASRRGAQCSRARDLVAVGLERDTPGREAEDVLHLRIEVDAVRRLGHVLALHGERDHALAHQRVEHQAGVRLAAGEVDAFHDRRAGAPVLDDAAAEVGEPRLVSGRARLVIDAHRVVHEVGDRTTSMGMQLEGEQPEHQRLEVVHQEAADDVGVPDPRAKEQAWGLERAGAEDDVLGGHLVRRSLGVEVAHAARPASGAVEHDLAHVRLGTDLAAARLQRMPQRRDGVTLCLDRAAVEGTEAAVVAGGPPVVLDAVHPGRRAVRVVSEPRRGLGRQHRTEHVGSRGHRVRAGTPRGERIPFGVAGHTDDPLGLGVVRLELVVVERPVDELGAVDRPQLGRGPEVDLAEAGELAVGVEAPAPDRRREVVHVAGEDAIAVGVGVPVRARLEQGVGAEEVPRVELQLVVADVPEWAERRVEREQVVPTLLEHQDALAGRGEHLGDGRAGGPRADDDRLDVVIRHAR